MNPLLQVRRQWWLSGIEEQGNARWQIQGNTYKKSVQRILPSTIIKVGNQFQFLGIACFGFFLMLAPACLVYETSARRFEAALKREFAATSVAVRPCHRAQDLFEQLRVRPGSIVIVDWEGGTDALTLVARLAEERLASGIVVLTPPHCDAELPLRELGATSVLPATTAPAHLARQCLMWLDRGASPERSGH